MEKLKEMFALTQRKTVSFWTFNISIYEIEGNMRKEILEKRSIILAKAGTRNSSFQGSISVCFGLWKERLAETGSKTQSDSSLLNLQFYSEYCWVFFSLLEGEP